MRELSASAARWKPAPDRSSVAEVLAHPSHSEWHCYGARLERFLAEPRPELEPDDAQCTSSCIGMRIRKRPSIGSRISGSRTSNGCAPSETRPGAGSLHKAAGEITLAHMLHEWALHDLGHIRQVAELVRGRKYLAGAGPLGADSHLRP